MPTVAGDGLVCGGLTLGSPCAQPVRESGGDQHPAPAGRKKGEPGNRYVCIQLIKWRQLKNGAGGGLEGFAPVMHHVSVDWVSKAEPLKSSHESSLPM